MPHPLNQLFYGPPGTGKTYAAITTAVRIARPELAEDADRATLLAAYRELQAEGRIVFTTFHQSLSYEDFVEGLKPRLDGDTEGELAYRIEPGVFRDVCTEAAFAIAQHNQPPRSEHILDFSDQFEEFLGHVQQELDDGHAVFLPTKGGNQVEIVELTDRGNLVLRHEHGKRNYTVSKDRQRRLHAGIEDFNAIKNVHETFREIIGGSNSSVHWAVLNAIYQRNARPLRLHPPRTYAREDKVAVIKTLTHADYAHTSAPAHILILDEINRGNVSRIFGELITLIEENKRLGRSEAITVKLPYSREEFGVPPNLFLIGTMNTADRSVAVLDSALRRRFRFREIVPEPALIARVGALPDGILTVDGTPFSLSELLEKINRRIEVLLDRDHLIGHSHFLTMTRWQELAEVMTTAILPQLEEYFFADYGQLQLVMGPGFCRSEPPVVTFAATGDGWAHDHPERDNYRIVRTIADEAALANALHQLLNTA